MNRRGSILLASMLVTFVLGSVHAFSVFIVPLEARLDLPRSDISLVYSFALVAITLAVLLGHRIYSSLPSWLLVLVACVTAAVGLMLASHSSEWWQLLLGYSLLFGVSNGVGYGYCLQLVGREMPEIKGIAMGAVTAAYAIGSIVFASIIAERIAAASIDTAFSTLALAIVSCGIVAAVLMRLMNATYTASEPIASSKDKIAETGKLIQFWLAYMTSVFAGLMAIGHAAGIALSKGSNTDLSTLSAMMIGIGSACGGFLAGWLVDRWPTKRFLVGLPLLSALALLLITLVDSPVIVIAFLTLVGFSYGSVIAIYPVVISNYFGVHGALAYGRVFTAWGFAGLVAPWTAGLIYDWQAGYGIAMVVAAAIAMVSALTAGLCRLEN